MMRQKLCRRELRWKEQGTKRHEIKCKRFPKMVSLSPYDINEIIWSMAMDRTKKDIHAVNDWSVTRTNLLKWSLFFLSSYSWKLIAWASYDIISQFKFAIRKLIKTQKRVKDGKWNGLHWKFAVLSWPSLVIDGVRSAKSHSIEDVINRNPIFVLPSNKDV